MTGITASVDGLAGGLENGHRDSRSRNDLDNRSKHVRILDDLHSGLEEFPGRLPEPLVFTVFRVESPDFAGCGKVFAQHGGHASRPLLHAQGFFHEDLPDPADGKRRKSG